MKGTTYVLGINCNMHQSAAVLLKNGAIVAGAEEERFTRKKYDSSFCSHAIEYCLQEAGITLADVDHVGFYWQPWRGLLTRIWWLIRYFPRSLQTFRSKKEAGASPFVLFQHLAMPRRLHRMGFRGKFHWVEHHLAHAASAFFVSPFKRAAIFTTDFCGEVATTLLGVGEGNKIRVLKRSYLPHSLGLFYGALTQFLGYKLDADEYRVMGLAPYGEAKYVEKFSSMVGFRDGAVRVDNAWFAFHLGGDKVYSHKWIETFGPPCKGENDVEKGEYRHYAASGQKALENVFLDVGTWVRGQTKEKYLVMAGGVALNSSANGKLKASGIFDDIWVQPSAYDPGCSLGAALFVWHQTLDNPRSFVMEHAYWGPEYSEGEMREAAEAYGVPYRLLNSVEREAARLLSEGKVIGWYQGRLEWGPRALGNRSILADPRRAEMKEVVNSKIKFREPYRPFAPSVLEEDAHLYFAHEGPSPYMLFVCPVKEGMREKIPAVTHVDGSARIQTVSRKTNPRYWNLISEFKTLTGVGLVLNTSFNVKGEPIVCTPEEAVRCFLNTEMDYLVMGRYLCSRPPKK